QEPSSEESTLRVVIESDVHTHHQPFEHINKLTKAHLLDNVIVKPKKYKDALKESSWIEAIQEEIHEFERLQVKRDEFGGVLKNKARLKKALYGLKQALRAWYDMLSKFLLSPEFSKGVVDPTIFTGKEGKDILLVQIYVDDIILPLLILPFVMYLLKL
ncbi:retrovirus-related pol polyprotein from transposon TNT 1-94, partial [Tanacetum coccineum]